MNTYTTDEHLFTWTKDHAHRRVIGSEEISTLMYTPGDWPDVLQLRSHKTGRTVRFERAAGVYSQGVDSELLYVVYVPALREVDALPNLQFVQLHILND